MRVAAPGKMVRGGWVGPVRKEGTAQGWGGTARVGATELQRREGQAVPVRTEAMVVVGKEGWGEAGRVEVTGEQGRAG